MTLETAGAVILVVSAISGIIFTIYKLRPESTKIFVDSAKVSVEMADKDRDDLQRRLAAKEAQCAAAEAEHNQYRKDAGQHIAEQAAQIRGLRNEVRHLTEQNERLQGGGPT